MTEQSRNQELDFYWAYTGLFFSVVSLLMAGAILFSRRGLYTPFNLILAAVSIFMAAAFAPCLLPEKWRGRLSEKVYIYPLLSLLVLVSPLLVWVAGRGLLGVYPAIALLGLLRSGKSLKKMDRAHLIFLLLAAPALAIYLFLYFNPFNYASVFAPEKALMGRLRKDSYYATTIAHMLQNYLTISTGLDGLVKLRYHVGAHFWFASLGKLTGCPPLFSYPVGLMVAGFPAQFLALVFAMICAAKARLRPVHYLGSAMLLVLVSDAIGRPSHYVSESYGFAVTALLFFFPLLRDIIARPRLSGVGIFARLGFLLAAVFILISLKISAGIIWSAALAWTLLRVYGKSRINLVMLPAMAVLGSAAFVMFNDPGQKAIFAPFKFFMSHPRLQFLGCWLVPSALLASAVLKLRIFRWRDALAAFRSRETLEMEIVVLVCLVGALPSLLFWLSIAWAWFFFNLGQWLAMPMLFSYFSLEQWRGLKHKIPAYAAAAVTLGLLGYQSAAHLSDTLELGYFDNFRKIIKTLPPHAPTAKADWSLYGPATEALLADFPGAKAYSIIMQAAAGKTEGFAVFVPPENVRFWGMVKNCVAEPMFVPAVTGKQMLFGLTPQDRKCQLEFYGYPDYHPQAHSREMDDQSLCRHARAKQIDSLLVLRDLDQSGRNPILDCKNFPP